MKTLKNSRNTAKVLTLLYCFQVHVYAGVCACMHNLPEAPKLILKY